jgi:DNA-binding NarL/FixJ family response regulator
VKEPIRIFIVDDHAVVRLGLQTMLESEPDIRVVGAAASGKEALELIHRVLPDIVVTDLRMREMKGAVMLTELRQICPQVRSIVLTT